MLSVRLPHFRRRVLAIRYALLIPPAPGRAMSDILRDILRDEEATFDVGDYCKVAAALWAVKERGGCAYMRALVVSVLAALSGTEGCEG